MISSQLEAQPVQKRGETGVGFYFIVGRQHFDENIILENKLALNRFPEISKPKFVGGIGGSLFSERFILKEQMLFGFGSANEKTNFFFQHYL